MRIVNKYCSNFLDFPQNIQKQHCKKVYFDRFDSFREEKGGKKQKKQKVFWKSKKSKSFLGKAKKADNDNDNGNDNDNDNDNDNGNGNGNGNGVSGAPLLSCVRDLGEAPPPNGPRPFPTAPRRLRRSKGRFLKIKGEIFRSSIGLPKHKTATLCA